MTIVDQIVNAKARRLQTVWQWADASRTRPANVLAYANNKTIGDGIASLFTFTNFFYRAGGSAFLNEVRVDVSKAGGTAIPAGVAVRAALFNAAFADPGADQSAYSQMEAQRAIRLGYVDLSASVTGGVGSDSFSLIGVPAGNGLQIAAAAASQDLVLLLVATGAWTPEASTVWMPGLKAVHN